MGDIPSSPVIRRLFDAFPAMDRIDISVTYADIRRTTYCETARRATDEKYILTVSDGGSKAGIECSGGKSAWYALCELARRVGDGTLRDGEFIRSPAFASRGYIEGFYGKPWTSRQRVDILRLAAFHGMNTVYYAPKDDPYHREKWRDLYPADALADLAALVREASEHYMDFYWCAAPGLSIRYSDDGDFEVLMRKTRQLYSIGVRCFGLLLDDIEPELSDAADQARYGETVNAHVDLVCRYSDALAALDETLRLTVCPTLYHGRGDEYYIAKLGRNIPARVSLFWTGRDICSRELTEFEALKFIESTRHKPLYWDNYPVNDMAMYNEMHLGPLIGRGPELWKYAEGLICNCMEYAECSKIPLITAAEYLWNGAAYEPEDAWRRAIREIVGRESAAVFSVFADHLRTSCLMDENSKQLIGLFFDVAKQWKKGEKEAALESAAEYIEKMRACREFLARDLPLCRELAKWTEKFGVFCELADKLLESFTSGGDARIRELHALLAKYDSNPTRFADDADIRIAVREIIGS